LAVELAETGITVSGFYPGPMKTSLFKNAGMDRDTSDYMDLPNVVRALAFIVETPETIEIPELGIKPGRY
jgi:short-subunit dehydrogenase